MLDPLQARSRRALASLLFLLAPSHRGTISSTVRDASGAIIPGAKVTVVKTNNGTTLNLTTSGSGDFTAPSLNVGLDAIRAERTGFRPSAVNAATSIRTDLTLDAGTSTQAVEVQASALTLSTENAKTSVTINNKMVDELPLVVGGTLRSPFDLAALTPEAKNLGGDNGFILGGGQAASYGTTLDGISANTTRALQQSWVAVNAPSIDAITEFTVDTNGFKAENGAAGGGTMTFVSKSGTNGFHGTAYEFLRNQKLDSNNTFNNARGIGIPIYKQHDYGGTVGGPVLFPKLYNGKNKSFFFVAYEAFRNRAGAAGVTIPIYDPTSQTTNAAGQVTRQQFPNNQIPRALFDPQVVKSFDAFGGAGSLKPNNGAAPGTVGYVNNNYLVTSGSEVRPNTKLSIKGDHNFSDRNRVSFYYGRNRSSVVPGALGPAELPGLYANYNDTTRNSDVYRASWDWSITPTIFNHFYGGGNDWKENHDPPQATVRSGIAWKDKVCIGNVPDCDQNLVNYNFSNGYSQWGGRANNGSENAIKSFADDVTIIKGKHTLKFGGMYQGGAYNGFGRQCVSGCISFSSLQTGRPADTNFATGGGSPIASMLLGYADGGGLDTIRYIGQQWPYFAGFAQDDFRVRPNLMINLGLRWETNLPPTGEGDRWSDFSPTLPNPRAGNIPGALLFAGTGEGRQGTRTLADSYYKAFGPRLGLAYTLNPKTVIRASYALSYGQITTVTGSTHQRGFTASPGFPNTSDGILPTFLVKNGFPNWDKPPFVDPGFALTDSMPWWQGKEATRPPAFQSFNFSIQRQLSANTIVETSYNGSLGSRLQAGLLAYNQVNPAFLRQYGPDLLRQRFDSPAAVAAGIKAPFPTFGALWGSRATVGQALKPFPQYNGIDTASGGGDHSGHSTYHAWMLRFEKRYSSGLQFQTSYVLSKLFTDADSYWVGGAAMDHFNRGLEKSIGQFDITNNFKAGVVWDLPFGKGRGFMNKGGVSNVVLGGWRLSSTHFYASGQPLPLGTTISLPLFSGGNRPQISSYDNWRGAVGGDKFDPNRDRFVQPASFFPTQVANTFGNMTRYNPKFRQMPNYNENISIAKEFRVNESIHVDFRAEAFNAFNRVRYGTGSLTLQDQNFGRLTSSADLLNTPRQLQLALKLYF